MKQLEAMPVHRRVGPCSKSPVTIHTPGWTEKSLSEVSFPKKQQEDRAKFRIPDLQIKSPRHQPQFQVGKGLNFHRNKITYVADFSSVSRLSSLSD